MKRKKKQKNRLTKHHRKSKYFGGGNHPKNISLVTQAKHRAFHILFSGRRTVHCIVRELNNVWIDSDYVLILERRKP